PAEPGPGALPDELRAAVRGLVAELDALFGALGLREESFAVGALSRVLAAELAGYGPARNRRRAAANRASVVFVDRTLDLAGAVGHHGDNLAEKILSVLPKLPGHKTDVMVNMVELTALQTPDEACSVIAPGCLAQPNDPAAKALWESFMSLKQKEAVMEARRHLVEAASRENLPIKMSMGRVTPEQLSSYIQLFRNNFKALENHCGLLQLVLAAVQTLKHPQISKWDNFLAFERLLLQTIGESEMPSVLNQLLPMIKSSSDRKQDDYSCEDFLVLLVYMYSVVGEIKSGKELDKAEEEVKKALVKAVCDEPELSPLLQKIT
ncbi:SCFD2 protein, partial [Penelope pileata]|nr:SCFD2 protein [Penelope pileata]